MGRRAPGDVEAGRDQLQRNPLFHYFSGHLLSTSDRQSGTNRLRCLRRIDPNEWDQWANRPIRPKRNHCA